LLSQALRPYSISLRRLPKSRVAGLLEEIGLEDMGALYEQLGLGERLAPVVAGILAQHDGDASELAGRRKPLEIAGTEGLVVNYARCCYPIPGDEIVGFMSSGRGIVIHRTTCGNLAEYRKQPSKWIPVDWKRSVEGDFLSEIQVR